jgi:uncharacterized membrane protein YbhN (UPF0104 family)
MPSLRPGKTAFFLAKIAIFAALAAWILSMVRKDDLLATLSRISPAYLLAAAGLMAVEWWLYTWKHRFILERAGVRIPMGKLLWLNLRIFAIALFLPGEVLGGGARLVLMRNRLGLEQCLFLMISDRYTQMAATLIFGIAACLAVPGGHAMLAVFGLCFLGLAAAPWLAFHPAVAARILAWLPSAWGEKARATLERLRGHFSLDRTGLIVLAFSAALQFEKAFFLWVLCFAVGIHVAFPLVIVYLTLIIVVQHLAISFGGLGVREATTVGFFGMYGVAPEKALVLSLALYAMHLAKASLGALAGLAGAGDANAPAKGISPAGNPAAPGRT